MKKVRQDRDSASLGRYLVPLGIVTTCLIWAGTQAFLSYQDSPTSIDTNLKPTTESKYSTTTPPSKPPEGETSKKEVKPAIISQEDVFIDDYTVKKRSTVYETLRLAGIDSSEIYHLTQAAKSAYDLDQVKSGMQILVHLKGSEQDLIAIEFRISATDTLWMRKQTNDWQAHIESKPITHKVLGYSGQVASSLWQSATNAGLDPQAIFLLSEIFAWQIDFEREIRPGDRWRMLIERSYVDGQEYGWGNIIGAEYKRGIDTYQAVRHPQEGPEGDYFTLDGESLKGKFLKSPLRYSRISSRFQLKRFHPILGVKRPHYGVDYAAPRGTPVRSVGDGYITVKGLRGGNGKMVKVKHSSSYQTAYKHLHNYAKGLRQGAKVKQGQIIGYVGSTGLATGPHLHFEFYENGKYTDPLGRKFPREDPIPPQDLSEFKLLAKQIFKQIDEHFPPLIDLIIAEGDKPGST